MIPKRKEPFPIILHDGTATVSLKGEINHHSGGLEAFRATVHMLIENRPSRVVLDLETVRYFSEPGLQLFRNLRYILDACNSTLKITSLSERVRADLLARNLVSEAELPERMGEV